MPIDRFFRAVSRLTGNWRYLSVFYDSISLYVSENRDLFRILATGAARMLTASVNFSGVSTLRRTWSAILERGIEPPYVRRET